MRNNYTNCSSGAAGFFFYWTIRKLANQNGKVQLKPTPDPFKKTFNQNQQCSSLSAQVKIHEILSINQYINQQYGKKSCNQEQRKREYFELISAENFTHPAFPQVFKIFEAISSVIATEVEEAIQLIKLGKAIGPESIAAEL